MIFLRSTLIFFAVILLFDNGLAQERKLSNDREYLLIAGYSPKSVLFLGKTPKAITSIIKLEYRKKTSKSVFGKPLYYQFGIIPFIEFDYPKRDAGGRRDLIQGFGVSPIGLGFRSSISRKISYSFYSYGGIILTEDKFPTDNGRKLNYTFSLSTDLILQANKYISFSLGYKFHHISNAQTGTENPGIDSNFITISLILSK